jgi:hypothetical protein
MKFALLGRQALMGVMAVALVAGMSVKTFAAENLLNKVKSAVRCWSGWKEPILRSASRAMTAS